MSVPWYLMAKGKGGGGYKTASGPIVSINDALAAPLRALTLSIDPVQDLHGYDNPWPGGGGKNKFNIADVAINEFQTVSGNTITKAYSAYNFDLLNGTTGQASLATKKISLAAGTYTISGTITSEGSTGIRVFAVDSDGVVAETHLVAINANTPYATFTLSESGYITLRYSAREACTVSNIQIEPGSSATTYAPYSNICPISGWDEVEMWRTGKNLAKLSSENAGDNQRSTVSYTDSGAVVTATGTYGRYGWMIPVKAGSAYTISYKAVASDAGNNNKIYFGSKTVWNVASDGYLSWQGVTTTEVQYSVTVTVPSDTLFIGLYVSALGTSGSVTISDLQVELSSTPTPYAPYSGDTYTIQLGQTVYGGYIQVGADGSAELVADMEYITLGGDDWAEPGDADVLTTVDAVLNDRYREAESGSAARIIHGISNYYATDSTGRLDNSEIRSNGVSSNKLQLVNYKDYFNVSSFAEFQAILNATPLQLVYELATPITIPLTPQEITTLAEQNVVWADCGEVTVEYLSAGGANADLMKLAVAFMGRK